MARQRDDAEQSDSSFGIPGSSPLTVEGHVDSLGRFFRGLKRRYPRVGRYLVALILMGFLLGLVRLNPFE